LWGAKNIPVDVNIHSADFPSAFWKMLYFIRSSERIFLTIKTLLKLLVRNFPVANVDGVAVGVSLLYDVYAGLFRTCMTN
jgi:hypothetical protein